MSHWISTGPVHSRICTFALAVFPAWAALSLSHCLAPSQGSLPPSELHPSVTEFSLFHDPFLYGSLRGHFAQSCIFALLSGEFFTSPTTLEPARIHYCVYSAQKGTSHTQAPPGSKFADGEHKGWFHLSPWNEGGDGKTCLRVLPAHCGPVTMVPDLSLMTAVKAIRPTGTANAHSPHLLETGVKVQRRRWESSFWL